MSTLPNPLIANLLAKNNSAPIDTVDAPALTSTIASPNSPSPSIGTRLVPTQAEVNPFPTQTQTDQTHRNQLINSGDGVSQVHNSVERGILRALDITGSVFAPRLAMALPGTSLHHNLLVNQATNNVAKDQAQEQAAAQTAGTQAETRHITDESNALEAPKLPEYDYIDGPNGKVAVQKGTTTATPVTDPSGKPLTAPVKSPANEFELWHQQNPTGTAADFQQLQAKPITQQQADALNNVYDQLPGNHPKGTFRAGMSTADATQLQTGLNAVVGKQQGAQSIVIKNEQAANSGDKATDAETRKEYTTATKSLTGQFTTAQKQSETLATARQEIGSGAVGQAVGTIKSLVGLAGGQGTGVRITTAELDSLAHARGISGNVEGFFNKLSGQGQMSASQVRQLDGLLADVQAKVQEKMGVQDKYQTQLDAATSPAEVRKIMGEYRKESMGGGHAAPDNGAPPAGAKVRDYSNLGGK